MGSTAPPDEATRVLPKELSAEHSPVLQTNLGAAISGVWGSAQHPRVQPCIPLHAPFAQEHLHG